MIKTRDKFKLSGEGGTSSPPATSRLLIQNVRPGQEISQTLGYLTPEQLDSIIPSMRTSKVQIGRQGAQKWLTGSGKGHSHQCLLNKFLDPSPPSMRKVDGGEKTGAGGIKKKRK